MSLADKARGSLETYRDLLLEEPSTSRIKRMLIAVNGWCNSRCTFCSIWQYDTRLALQEEITLDELERHLFGSAALAGLLDIGVTGGEPFLRRDLAAVCHSMYAHFPRARIGIVTNGLQPARIADVLAEIVRSDPSRELSLAISLDGYGEAHDRVRGVPGNFERVLQAVELVKERTPTVSLGFSHTITPTSCGDSIRCYELARELGIGFMYRLAHSSPYLRNGDVPIWSGDSIGRGAAVAAELAKRLQADQRPLARLANTHYAANAFYAQMASYAERPRRMFDCFSGTHSFFLAHTGDVYPCINLDHPMGNLRHEPFDELWPSERANDVRQPIAEWQCHCWTNCETELSLGRQKRAFAQSLQANLLSLIRDRS